MTIRSMRSVRGRVGVTVMSLLLIATTLAIAPVGAQSDSSSDAGVAGTFFIQDQNFNRYLEERATGNVGTSSAAVSEWNVVRVENGYLIQSIDTGYYLDADAENNNVDVSPDATDDVLWDLIDNGDGTYRINNVSRDRAVDADLRGDFNVIRLVGFGQTPLGH